MKTVVNCQQSGHTYLQGQTALMDNTLIAALLGLIEGLTEFLPVSSSAHMALAGQFLDFHGPRAATFEIVIQLGAIMAVVTVYWRLFLGLLKPGRCASFAGLRGIWLLILTTFPACVCGLLLHSFIKKYLFSPLAMLCALVTGAFCMLATDFRRHGAPDCKSLDEITPKLALGIGLAQCAALWPGFSRSAATIMGALILGASRPVAVQYSFIAAVPVMFAATAYDLLRNYALFSASDIGFFAVGLLVAYFSALMAIRFFIRLLGRINLVPFAIYRLCLAPLVYFFLVRHM